MRKFFSIFALTGFFSSVFVHLSTFFGTDLSKHIPRVWVLHLGVFVAFIPMLLLQGLAPKKDWNQIFATIPRWARYSIKVFFAYALINFALFFFLSESGVPDVRDGKYVLHNHGQIIRELSENDYEWQKAYVLRVFSGHWMAFYLLPAIVLWFRRKSAHPDSFN